MYLEVARGFENRRQTNLTMDTYVFAFACIIDHNLSRPRRKNVTQKIRTSKLYTRTIVVERNLAIEQ
jgi:hypothetical protein